MKLYCPVSGVNYTSNQGIGSFTLTHPTLSLSVSALKQVTKDQLINRSKNNEKNHWRVNSYLLLLSWFVKLPSIQVTSTISIDEALPVLLANQEQLIRTVLSVNSTKLKISYPGIIVSKENQLQDQLANWLDAFEECIRVSQIAVNETRKQRTARELEESLDSVNNIFLDHSAKKNAKLVADWACASSRFPHSVSSYWKDIIICLFKSDGKKLVSMQVSQADIDELTEHCEDQIPHGSYHAHELMARLRDAHKLMGKHIINSRSATVQTELVDTDEDEPIEEDYETKAEFLRAKSNYLASKLKVSKVSSAGIVTTLEL